MLQEAIISNLEKLPEKYQQKILDFSDFLLSKINQDIKVEKSSRGGFGARKGNYIMADDFDAPLEDFKE